MIKNVTVCQFYDLTPVFPKPHFVCIEILLCKKVYFRIIAISFAVWFQNKRAKVKKSSGVPNALALQLLAEGLYNHCSQPTKTSDDEEKQE